MSGPTLDSLLAKAAEIERSGRVVEAIRLLHAENRARSSVEVERALARMRHGGFKKTHQRPALDERPPVSVLEHPAVGLAYVTAGELTAHRMRSAILAHGSLYVPGLLDARQIQRLKDAIDSAIAARRPGEGRVQESAWYEEAIFCGGQRAMLGEEGVFAGDSPRGLFQLMETFYELGLDTLLTEYFAEPPILSFEKCTMRRLNPSGGSSWHQDGAFLGTDIRSLNVWITLSQCGREAPSMDVIPCRVDRILPTGAFFDWDLSPQVIASELPNVPPRVVELEPGDALFFDHFFVHRTFRAAKMTKRRYAIENWFFAPSAYPVERTGFVV